MFLSVCSFTFEADRGFESWCDPLRSGYQFYDLVLIYLVWKSDEAGCGCHQFNVRGIITISVTHTSGPHPSHTRDPGLGLVNTAAMACSDWSGVTQGRMTLAFCTLKYYFELGWWKGLMCFIKASGFDSSSKLCINE